MKGSCVKKIYPSEEKWRRNARKSLTAARTLSAGEVLKAEDVKIMRPGTGIHPQYFDILTNRKLQRDVKENQLLSLGDF